MRFFSLLSEKRGKLESQILTGSEKKAFHRRNRRFQNGGNILVRQFLVASENDCHTLRFGQ